MATDSEIDNKISEWTTPPFDTGTINELKELIKAGNEKELTDRFYTNLEFGTGGLRGILGAGTNRMNIYTVGMATQGLANYISLKGLADKGVVIAFDSRIKSDVFSREAACILAGNNIKVFLFDDLSPTPLCSFAVRELGTASGIVITASHNPPEYNGYKVYWEDGGQIIPPDDKAIIEEVRKIDSVKKIIKADYDTACRQGKITIIGKDIIASYLKHLGKATLRPVSASDIKIVYSPLHGAGYRIVPETLKHFGFNNIFSVEQQSVPDGSFPTLEKPNPEEKEAMAMSIQLAVKVDADIIMATDPDADRMGVGFKDPSGEYILINGNQIGTMLEYYILSRMHSENRLPQKGFIVKTIVTTELQDEIAAKFGMKTENVLTGFKWIAKKIKDYEESGKGEFIFGGEESYGYLPVSFVRDKDAISSCYFFAEMTDWLMQNGKTLYEFLNDIYINNSLYAEDLHSITLKGKEGMENMKKIMNSLRDNPPSEFDRKKVIRIHDIGNLTITDTITGKTEKIKDIPSSDVLQFYLEDNTKVTVRPSGTEPKIKFYFSARTSTGKETLQQNKLILQGTINRIKQDMTKKIEKML